MSLYYKEMFCDSVFKKKFCVSVFKKKFCISIFIGNVLCFCT